MSAKIHIERMMYRSSVSVSGDSAASYALVKLIPAGEGAAGVAGDPDGGLGVAGGRREREHEDRGHRGTSHRGRVLR